MKRWFRKFAIPPLVSTLLSIGCPAPIFAQPADMLPLASATIQRSPAEVATWPATVQITGVTINTNGTGIGIQTAAPIPWPDFIPPGFTGPLQYTVWVCVTPAAWQCMGDIQMWRTRNVPPDGSLPALPSQWSLWWGSTAGGATGGGFGSYVPSPGDTIGFFIAAGNERGSSADFSVKERSNVVTLQLVAGDTQTVTFPSGNIPAPPAPPIVPSGNDALNSITNSLNDALNRIGKLETAVAKLQIEADGATSDLAIVGGRLAALENDVTTLQSRTIPMSCSASVAGIPIHCALK